MPRGGPGALPRRHDDRRLSRPVCPPGRPQGRMSGDLRIETVEDAAALEALAPAWWDLWRRCPAATPFTSPAWALPWWRTFGPGKLCGAAVWDGHALVALAPIYLEEGALGARLLPIGIGISDALDVLVDPAVQDKAGRAL